MMSKLMDELMAEAQRVNALEIEIDQTIANQKDSVKQGRYLKAQSIAMTLDEFRDALIEADAMRAKNNGAFFVLPGISIKEKDGYVRSIGIIFYTDSLWVGRYYCGSGWCERVQSFNHVLRGGNTDEFMNAVIDCWGDDVERRIEKACAEHIKETLANRIERATRNLKKSNDEYARYVKE